MRWMERSHSHSGFLSPSSLSVSALFANVRAAELVLGQRIGPYVMQEILGTGGFADVFLAARDGEFEQKVALKLINASVQTRDDIMARFLIERQVLANLGYPNIAHLLDGGRTTDGRPYLVMEYVDGQRITDYCDGKGLAVDERLRLFQVVYRAVGYAHRHGVGGAVPLGSRDLPSRPSVLDAPGRRRDVPHAHWRMDWPGQRGTHSPERQQSRPAETSHGPAVTMRAAVAIARCQSAASCLARHPLRRCRSPRTRSVIVAAEILRVIVLASKLRRIPFGTEVGCTSGRLRG
jgi:Protein kinase domain